MKSWIRLWHFSDEMQVWLYKAYFLFIDINLKNSLKAIRVNQDFHARQILYVFSDPTSYLQLIEELRIQIDATPLEQQSILAYIIMYNYDNDLSIMPPSDLNELEDIFIVNEVIFQRDVVKNESLSLEKFIQILQSPAIAFSKNLWSTPWAIQMNY